LFDIQLILLFKVFPIRLLRNNPYITIRLILGLNKSMLVNIEISARIYSSSSDK